jgi:oligoribonuclease NrnB/cAMP/cGMP phosphodiesterase (DHH superfamily)
LLKRVLVIGHNDLDGVAGVLAVKAAHKQDHVVTKFCSYSNIDSTLIEAINNSRISFDRIVLVDICFSPELDENSFTSVSERWNTKFKLPEAVLKFTEQNRELVVLDHHPKSLKLYSTSYRSQLSSDSIIQMSDANGNLQAGSDLAAIYFLKNQKRENLGKTLKEIAYTKALVSLCEICGTYDVWNKNSYYFELGSKFAVIQSLMSDDCYSFLNELESMLANASEKLLLDLDQPLNNSFWKSCLTPILSFYLEKAEDWFEQETKYILKNVIQHSPKLHEIHANFFESLLAEVVYTKTKGIVLVRYEKSRDKVSKVSLRKHSSISVNLGNIAKQFGGGGHYAAAGMTLKNHHTIQDVVDTILYSINS